MACTLQWGHGAIIDALGQLMQRHGVTVRLNTTITKINVENGVATSVLLADGRSIAADVVVSNADPAHLYESMVAKKPNLPPTS